MINVSRMGVLGHLFECRGERREERFEAAGAGLESNYPDGGGDLPFESRAIIHL